jgi:hypothetical protein
MTKQSDRERDRRLMFCLTQGLPIPNDRSLSPATDGPIPAATDPAALRRVQVAIARLKAMTFTSWGRDRTFEAGQAFYPAQEGRWQELSETGKLAVLDFWVDWDGVSLRDRRAELLKHIDTTKLPPEIAQHLAEPKGNVLDGKSRAGTKPRQKARDIEPER